MHGYSSTCLVDSGPVLTFIPSDFPGLQHTTVSPYTHTSLLTAGGTPLVTSGMCTLSVQIGNNTVSHEFVVVNNLSTGPLLGADFLKSHGVTVDFQNGLFRWFSQALPLTSFTDMTCRLVFAESVLIPASSSLVCNAKIQSYDGSLMQAVGERMFLPGEKMLDSHNVATLAVVDCTSGIVPVHIVNVHEEDRTLFKNVTLGTV